MQYNPKDFESILETINNTEIDYKSAYMFITDRDYFYLRMGDKANNFRTKHYKHRHFKKIIKKYS